ncbi:hypothetical protein AMIS_2330 [Actinoplanes missouriensis 431]|uniref:Holin n=1 Tax=Actinoplanes missouriensis (strain ATCC 14538 / DSM 43046 / CBS 188.64 / JCM 3121 / NBRC 102363 / NCIMB 12654 / NRRL B-3342 / UNCC 431) TaxID=512565 RepID=I0GXG6_ACTM4|nr:holin [Actinoplanes missouriensis]KOX45255.1 hypothetical protein ADL19_23300 [Streptomyces purpurogeneiscleroticus]BAL85453.1 hypothetical protein AMIS_2330 [Actinoplanes missouriensis 431]
MFKKVFWLATGERAVKSSAQALLLLWGGDAFNLFDVDPLGAAGIAGGAAVLSVLTSIVSTTVGDSTDPSLLPTSATADR